MLMLRPPSIVVAGAMFVVALGVVSTAQDRPVFTAESDLVVLHVLVKDRRGANVAGLTADAFRVTENGRPQTVGLFVAEDAPVTVGLILDSSGSMMPNRERVIAASAAFVGTSNPQDEVFVLMFNDEVRPLPEATSPFTSDQGMLRSALAKMFVPTGRTALYDAIINGLAYLAKGSRDRRVLVVLSDGGDNARRATFADALGQVRQSNTTIFTVALVDPLDDEANPKRLKAFAESSGGEAFSPHDISEVDRDFQQIARDVRQSYTIGYEPSDVPAAPTFHRIHVEARSPDGRRLTTRTRTEYLAGSGAGMSHAR
jgi:VWFA-related protein